MGGEKPKKVKGCLGSRIVRGTARGTRLEGIIEKYRWIQRLVPLENPKVPQEVGE